MRVHEHMMFSSAVLPTMLASPIVGSHFRPVISCTEPARKIARTGSYPVLNKAYNRPRKAGSVQSHKDSAPSHIAHALLIAILCLRITISCSAAVIETATMICRDASTTNDDVNVQAEGHPRLLCRRLTFLTPSLHHSRMAMRAYCVRRPLFILVAQVFNLWAQDTILCHRS